MPQDNDWEPISGPQAASSTAVADGDWEPVAKPAPTPPPAAPRASGPAIVQRHNPLYRTYANATPQSRQQITDKGLPALEGVAVAAPLAMTGVAAIEAPLATAGSVAGGYLGQKAGGAVGGDVGSLVGHPEVGRTIGKIAGGLAGGIYGGSEAEPALKRLGVPIPEWMRPAALPAGAIRAPVAGPEAGPQLSPVSVPMAGPAAAQAIDPEVPHAPVEGPVAGPAAAQAYAPLQSSPPSAAGTREVTGLRSSPEQGIIAPRTPERIAGDRTLPPAPGPAGPTVEAPGEAYPAAAPPKTTKQAVTDIVNQAYGVKPLEPNVPLRETIPAAGPTPEPQAIPAPAGEQEPMVSELAKKYPNKAVRQMVHVQGENMVNAVGDNPELMRQIHDLTAVDIRQALINSGEDMGQTPVTSSKFAGPKITRQEGFDRLLAKGLTPAEIVKLAKSSEAPK